MPNTLPKNDTIHEYCVILVEDTLNVQFQVFQKDESVPLAWLAEGSACVRAVRFLGVPVWNECQYCSDPMALMEELNL